MACFWNLLKIKYVLLCANLAILIPCLHFHSFFYSFFCSEKDLLSSSDTRENFATLSFSRFSHFDAWHNFFLSILFASI